VGKGTEERRGEGRREKEGRERRETGGIRNVMEKGKEGTKGKGREEWESTRPIALHPLQKILRAPLKVFGVTQSDPSLYVSDQKNGFRVS
jgi:hypothetical protein